MTDNPYASPQTSTPRTETDWPLFFAGLSIGATIGGLLMIAVRVLL